ncbi:MAG: type II toxin-antitoxin system VapC family toxin [Candidatus Bathyarchaeia archaeon]
MRLFVDTSAFIALEDEDDENHEAAVEYRNKLRERRTPYRALYTSNYITDETLTLLRIRCGHRVAVTFGEVIRSSRVIRVLWITPTVEKDAWKIFKEHEDRDFSFTDCTSFALMEAEAIDTAFTFDRHFSQYKLRIVP